MKNRELAKIFYEIADYLEMDNVPFKPYAYQKAAITLETLKEDVEEIYARGGTKSLKEIPGIGRSIALKIEEYLRTGHLEYYDRYKEKMPIDLTEIISVTGMGPKKGKNPVREAGCQGPQRPRGCRQSPSGRAALRIR